MPNTSSKGDLRKLLEDHQWHDMEYTMNDRYREAFCLREDGRLLAMPSKQFNDWNDKHDTRQRLSDMAMGRSEQIELEKQGTPFEAADGVAEDEVEATDRKAKKVTGQIKSNEDISTIHENHDIHDRQRKYDSGVKHGRRNQNKQARQNAVRQRSSKGCQTQSDKRPPCENCGHKSTERTCAVGNKNGAQSCAVYHNDENTTDLSDVSILPPCYCWSCSEYFWNDTKGSFSVVIPADIASRLAESWLHNIASKAIDILQELKNRGKTLRKRWAKKKYEQRRDFLNRVCPSLMAYSKLGNLLREPFGHHTLNRKLCSIESTVLTAGIVLDDLVADSDALFRHLQARSHFHPAEFFFADFTRLQAAREVVGPTRRPYIFGTFNVTPADYGKWQKWEDGPVHRSETVVATHALLVFDSQSEIQDVLFNILSELGQELPLTAVCQGATTLPAKQKSISLPTLAGFMPLQMELPYSKFELVDAASVVRDQLKHVQEQLAILRSDNGAFVNRMKFCRAFHDAANSSFSDKKATVAYSVLAEPHDRVIVWLNIAEHTQTALKLWIASKDSGLSSVYVQNFGKLVSMLHFRLLNLAQAVIAFCRTPTTPEAIVPGELWRYYRSVGDWLSEHFFSSPLRMDRLLRTTFAQACFQQQAKEVQYINDLVKDWIGEGLVLTRLYEILWMCGPTIQSCPVSPLDDADSMCYKMSPRLTLAEHKNHVATRCETVKHILQATIEYTSPSGPRNEAWHAKQESAGAALKRTWADYGIASIKYYKSQGFKEEWLQKVVGAMTGTESPEVCLGQSPQNEPQSPSEVEVEEQAPPESSIPHHFGPDTPKMRKMTQRQREDLNPPSEQDEVPVISPIIESGTPTVPLNRPPIQIAVRECDLEVVKSLFSNAQQQVASVRWSKFLSFMKNAGCKVKSGSGSSVIFTSRNGKDGQRATVVLHRPHPDSTLRAVHLRNCRFRIVEAFGWQAEMFVVRR